MPGVPLLDGPEDVRFVAELDFALGGMDVDVYFRGRDGNVEDRHGMAAGHEEALVGFLHGEGQGTAW
jgi:hypothetical protein